MFSRLEEEYHFSGCPSVVWLRHGCYIFLFHDWTSSIFRWQMIRRRLLQDICKKTSCRHVLKTSWKMKKCYAEDAFKTSSRLFQHIFTNRNVCWNSYWILTRFFNVQYLLSIIGICTSFVSGLTRSLMLTEAPICVKTSVAIVSCMWFFSCICRSIRYYLNC